MACSSGGDDEPPAAPRRLTREGSTESAGTLSTGDPPLAYRVTYRVRAAAAGGVTESTETIEVRRPFESRVEVQAADGTVTARRVSRFGALVVEGDGGVRVLGVPPSLGTSDVRPDAALDDAVDRGLAEAREVRSIGGRRCRVYRVGSTASDGTLVPVGATAGEHADVCVDGSGLVLEEWWVRDGEPLRQRLAVAIDADADADGATFRLDGEPPTSDGEVRAVQADPAAVEGFDWLGRFEVVTAALSPPGSGSDVAASRTSVVDVWTRGADFLAHERAPGTVAPTPFGMPVEIAGVGPAELVVDLRASELRLTTATGDTVRIYGTLAPDDLVAAAQALLA